MRRVMVLLMLALGGVAFGPAPAAYACGEPMLPFDRQVSHADHIFTGTVASMKVDPSQAGARAIYQVKVNKVFKGGNVEKTIRVATPTRVADCGLGKIVKGDQLIFFLGEPTSSNYFEAVSYEGTRLTTTGIEANVIKELTPKPKPEDIVVTLTKVDHDQPVSVARAVAPGLILTMFGVVALVVGRLFGRPRT